MRIFAALFVTVLVGLWTHALGGLHFNTSNGVSNIGAISSTPTNVTIALWKKQFTTPSGYDALALLRFGSGHNIFLMIYDASGNLISEAYYDSRLAASLSVNTGYNTNQWTHLATTFEYGRIVSYVNGSPVGTNTTAWGAAPTGYGSTASVEIGSLWYFGTLYHAYDGELAECAVFDRALSAGEIKGLSAGQSPLMCGDKLVFYDPLISTNGWNAVRSPRTTWYVGGGWTSPSLTNSHPKTYKP